MWASRSAGYKGAAKSHLLKVLAEEVLSRDWFKFAPGARDAYAQNDDAFDALISALVARAHRVGLCESIPDVGVLAHTEGWIAIPTHDSLDLLPHSRLAS
jgi:hypothetical protein